MTILGRAAVVIIGGCVGERWGVEPDTCQPENSVENRTSHGQDLFIALHCVLGPQTPASVWFGAAPEFRLIYKSLQFKVE